MLLHTISANIHLATRHQNTTLIFFCTQIQNMYTNTYKKAGFDEKNIEKLILHHNYSKTKILLRGQRGKSINLMGVCAFSLWLVLVYVILLFIICFSHKHSFHKIFEKILLNFFHSLIFMKMACLTFTDKISLWSLVVLSNGRHYTIYS